MNRARTHEKEIGARPKKTWFQSEGDKQKLKQMSNAMVNGVDLMTQVEEQSRHSAHTASPRSHFTGRRHCRL